MYKDKGKVVIMKNYSLEQFKLFLKSSKNVESLRAKAKDIKQAGRAPIQALTEEEQKLVSQAITNLRKAEIK